MKAHTENIKEDVWIETSCGGCYGQCGTKVHRVDGVVVEIEGNPESPAGSGRICSKGTAQLMTLYDPHRINYPVKRTNPEKGVGVDPKWERISWEEAYDIIVSKMKAVYEKDPRGVYFQATTVQTSEIRFAVVAFMRAFGFKNYWVSGGGLWCGNGAHFMNGITHAAWSIIPDWNYNNYTLYFGCSKGHGAGHAALQTSQWVADARARGMKAVVFDPYLSTQASKGHEWVPIRVGTDAAAALGMINVILNELDMYDAEYLKLKTNAPYLIQEDGHYKRDPETNKPLIWDSKDGKAKTFDDDSIKDYALLGTFDVGGTKCQPSFQLFKEHVKKEYPLDKVEEITTVSESTLRRVAKDFVEHAQIGSTITIKGKSLPLRPSAAIFFRGSQGHKNSGWTCLCIDMLNHMVGAADVPGGAMGHGPPVSMGHPDTGKPNTVPYPCDDGLMVVKGWVYDHKPYPLGEPGPPTRLDLQDMFPCSVYNAFTIMSEDWEKYLETFKIDYRPSIMINFGSNSVMTMGNAEQITENFLKKFEFIFSFNIYQNEFTEAVADVVLPDACFLERYTPCVTFPSTFSHPTGMDEWVWQIRQPVVESLYERRDFSEVMLELSKKLGIQDKYYQAINAIIPVRYGGEMEKKYELDTKADYSWQDICDRVLRDRLGDEKGLEALKKTGLVKWPTKVEEMYWRWFVPVRIPIYFEFFLDAGKKLKKVLKQFGREDMFDLSYYEPLAQWNPCPSHTMDNTEYDLWAFCWRPSFHTQSSSQNNPWLDEISVEDPFVYLIQINEDIGKKKGINDNDMIWIENSIGKRIKGNARLIQGLHPEHVCVAGCHGHWAKGTPVAKNKGIFFDDLIIVDEAHTDPLNQGTDACVKVKIYKCEEEAS
ncbi:MAG: molybdopterin-dependent oxidoreductase [Candidatus Aminicenantes bacterium]|nr:molybdopterin-dependent oxidoreductase [Candidatus Aminicenantes bacterium]